MFCQRFPGRLCILDITFPSLMEDFPVSPKICRLQQHLSAGEHQQDLFQSLPVMFVSPLSQPPPHSLEELIRLCGGAVCRTIRRAGICIGEYRGRKPEGTRCLSEQWILGEFAFTSVSWMSVSLGSQQVFPRIVWPFFLGCCSQFHYMSVFARKVANKMVLKCEKDRFWFWFSFFFQTLWHIWNGFPMKIMTWSTNTVDLLLPFLKIFFFRIQYLKHISLQYLKW